MTANRCRSGTHPSAAHLVLAATLALCAWSARAEVYRYQDAEGRWQFSDRPPPGAKVAQPPASDSGQTRDNRDLASRLQAAFHPGDPIARATLAVVSVKAELGEGAGFFVTDSGYILTNRHVVRPEEPAPMVKRREEIERAERRLAAEEARYTRESVETARRQLREARRELDWKSAASAAQSSFQIRLKDGETLTARLIAASDSHDLALLKLDGYRTPRVPLNPRLPAQDAPVRALGNPLGVGDSLFSGRVASLRQDLIVTDVQLLPGNSGGPLIDSDGKAIGVNFAKLTQGDNASYQGLGMTIPIGVAIAEFPELR